MGRPKKAAAQHTDDAGTVSKVRRIGVELPDELTAEIAEYVAGKPFLREVAVRDAVREAARTAAETATVGRVADIMAALLQ